MLLGGTAPDGGLWMPATWPELSAGEVRALAGLSYEETAQSVLRPFVEGVFNEDALREILADAYTGFSIPERVALRSLGRDRWLLELHHGPTLAFKDLAMQVLARMMERALARRGRRAVILGATSGDTGSAAIEAFRGLFGVEIFILFPEGRVSEVQRRQMTTPTDANVHAIAIRGDFDDAQRLVKALFADSEFRKRVELVAVNSINWVRIAVQAVYYFYAALRLGAPARRVAFCVPSGNFGDAFAGYAAGRMGLPVERLLVATNSNDILHRIIDSGRGERCAVTPTSSPSMDIQVASNFERALFEAAGGDGDAVRRQMEESAATGVLALRAGQRSWLGERFASARADEAETRAAMRRAREEHGILVDPHTAVGLHAADSLEVEAPCAILATAHPAKFPSAVKEACGVEPPRPARLRAALAGEERVQVVDADATTIRQIIERRVQS